MATLACLWTRPRLQQHVDGALGPRAARRIEGHLRSCSHCFGRTEVDRRLRVMVRDTALDPIEPDWSTFWPGIRAKLASEPARRVRDAWWLPFWRPFWGHPRLALSGAVTAGLAVTLAFWPAAENQSPIPWAGPVIVQDVSTPDPDRSVMVYSSPDQTLTVIWLFNSGGSADES